MRMTETNRRQFLAAMGLGGLFYTVRGAFAQQLLETTPAQTLGPYYPNVMPLDLDNDLLILNDATTPAVGEISWIGGRVLDRRGEPVRGALVEIWQADNNGAYIHTASPIANRDRAFQGYGKFVTGSTGDYLFRTVKPGLYPGRTRHVHFQITAPGGTKLVTQLYVEGDALNNSDGVLRGVPAAQRAMVVVPWTRVEASAIAELAARFDIVTGYTPAENAAAPRPLLVSMVNAANFVPGGAAGGLVTLYGLNLSTVARQATAAELVDGRLPESVEGVSVRINDQPAAITEVGPDRVTVQAPAEPGTKLAVTLHNGAGTSAALTVDLAVLMPGLFLGEGGYVLDRAAAPGETIAIYGTGFGSSVPPAPAGMALAEPLPLANAVKIQIDNTLAIVSEAVLERPGMYRFRVVVPDLADGDHAVTADCGGVRAAKAGRLRIQRV